MRDVWVVMASPPYPYPQTGTLRPARTALAARGGRTDWSRPRTTAALGSARGLGVGAWALRLGRCGLRVGAGGAGATAFVWGGAGDELGVGWL